LLGDFARYAVGAAGQHVTNAAFAAFVPAAFNLVSATAPPHKNLLVRFFHLCYSQ
jgi:hypothetical protein